MLLCVYGLFMAHWQKTVGVGRAVLLGMWGVLLVCIKEWRKTDADPIGRLGHGEDHHRSKPSLFSG